MNPFIKVVFFNLKTTSFKGPLRLLQIGAVNSFGRKIFGAFVHPGPISPKALRGSGFQIKGNELHRDDIGALMTRSVEEALLNFMDCLNRHARQGKVILVAHQCGFHGKFLLELLTKFNIPFRDTILGFCDSLKASRALCPGVSHKLSDMLEEVGLPGGTENDAVSDAGDCLNICRCLAGQNGMTFLFFIRRNSWYTDLDEFLKRIFGSCQ